MRVIHKTARFMVVRFNGAVVIERDSAARAYSGPDADKVLAGWSKTIAQSVNTRPLAKPFAVDDYLETIWESGNA